MSGNISGLRSVLTEQDVRRLDPVRVIDAIESAFRERFETSVMPVRTAIPINGGILLVMPCYDPVANSMGMKLVSVLENPVRPEDRIQATYLLVEPDTARPLMTIPANYLTDLRTAATSAVATRHLARADARTLGIFGTGRQARAHARLLPLVRQFARVLVCGSDIESSRRFAEETAAELGCAVDPVDAQTCAGEADVLCTCTTSHTPLFEGALLRPGCHLNVVGAFQPATREIDDVTVQRARVVADTYEGVLAEAGDLLIPIGKGVIPKEHIVSDLHELVSGKKQVRQGPDDITLFKSVGCALEDLVTAELIA